jgi:ParB/RepB/Spo0J family partition protein
MSKATPKITLSRSQDIPFNKLILSQANVRRVKAGISVEELAADIARRGLLQSLSVRPVLDADGAETGMYEIPAGGRRYRALELLVKQKRMAKTQTVPCVVRTEGLAEEDSLAENIQRVALHPLDQFRAFQTLRDQGLSEEEIAARFFVTPAVVKQRLKLASVSPKLLDLYAADEMTLEQLMAFTVTGDHARQEQVWEAVSRGWNKEPYLIRRQLTEGAVAASDRRAQFVSVEAYEAAGGVITRDLFEDDEGGWLQDAALLDRLVAEKLTREAEALRGEGWKWIEAAVDSEQRVCRSNRYRSRPYAAWRGPLRPLLQTYLVEIAYRAPAIIELLDVRVLQPRVRIVSPALRRRSGDPEGSLPHVYYSPSGDVTLCLLDPDAGEWSPFDSLAQTTVPWVIDWLAAYEGWRATGEWTASGRHVEPERRDV